MSTFENWAHVSASQLKTFAACPKKWAWEKLYDQRGPATEPMFFGTTFHFMAEYLAYEEEAGFKPHLEHFKQVAAGATKYFHLADLQAELEVPVEDKWLRKAAQLVINGAALDYITPMSPGTLLEASIGDDTPLYLAGVKVVGFIDVLRYRRGKCIIEDHKTTSSWRWALSPMDLTTDIQLNLYAAWAFNKYPDLEEATVIHNQFNKKNLEVRRAESTLKRGPVLDRLARYEAAVAQMVEYKEEAANHDDPGFIDVEHKIGDPSGPCGMYGGCPFVDKCLKRNYNADEPFAAFGKPTRKGDNMSRLKELMKKKRSAPAPAPTPAPAVLPPEAPESEAPTPKKNETVDAKWFTAIPGIGQKTAENIVEYLLGDGYNTYGALQKHPDLSKIKGVGPSTAETIRAALDDELVLDAMLGAEAPDEDFFVNAPATAPVDEVTVLKARVKELEAALAKITKITGAL